MSNNIIDQLSSNPGQAQQSESINGLFSAIVTNTKDPEKQGRVKVKFLGQGITNETYWVRVAMFMAGKDRGAFFLPEVGDEVLVAFIHGNIDFPVVIGALWGNVDKPPVKNADGKNNIKMYKSRAGHQLTFDDSSKEKKAKLEIKSSGGHTITINDASGREKIEIKDKSGKNKISIDATKKSIDIACDMKLTIKAKMIDIDAKGVLNIKGKMVNLQAQGIAQVKGTMVKIN